MRQYRFLVVRHDRSVLGDFDVLFSCAEEACAEALKTACELATDGDAFHGFEITVIDERGQEVTRVPVLPRYH
jgi:hypothetical protein